MHTLDGEQVVVGDFLYDTQYGRGQVEQLLVDNRVVVLFSGLNRRHVYNSEGVGTRFHVRTLYWHDPIIVVPAKSDTGWLKIQQVCLAVIAALRA